jgi:hypothetical protein
MTFLLAGGDQYSRYDCRFALARRPVFLAYLGFAFVGAVVAGIAYSLGG